MKTGTELFTRWILRWRWLILIVSILGVMAIGSGAKKIQLQNNYRIFFSKENPQLKSFEELQNIYSKEDNVMFVLSHPRLEVFTPEFLQSVAWLTEEAWKLPFSTRVDSITNFQHSEAEGDDLIVDDLVPDPSNASADLLKKAKAVAELEPLIANRLIGKNPHVTGVNVTMMLPEKDATEAVQAAAAARELNSRFQKEFPEFQVHITGMVMLNNAFAESSMNDMQFLIPIMYAGIFVIMGILLRSVTGTIGSVVVILFAAITAMGMMGWLGIPLTPPSAIAPTIIMTLAVADSIHILITFFQELRRGRLKNEAIVESLRVNFQPVFLTSLTTSIGFLSMNFSDAPPFRHLGNIVAIGVWAAWFFSVVLLPALISILPVKVKKNPASQKSHFDWLVDLIIKHRPTFLWGSVGVIVLLAAFVPRIELNDQWVDYFSKKIPFRNDTDYVMEHLTGIYTIEYSIESGESSGISEPKYLEKLEEFTQWFRQQPGVLQINSLTDIMKRLNKNLNADNPDYFRIPDSRELAAQFLLLFEMSLPYGLDLNNRINVDKSASRFTVTVENLTTRRLRELIDQGDAWQKEYFPEVMQSTATSPSVMFAYISERNIHSMLGGTAIAVVLISLIIGFALRSLKFGFISLIPNFVPAIMGFGVWAILVGSVGMSLSVVTGMTLGIVVDDTVHFISKYLRARREKKFQSEEAIRYAFSSVGKALVVTTVILVIGFAILSFSSFRMNGWMGQLTAIVIVCALVADFLLLPALLLTFDRNQKLAMHPTNKKQSIHQADSHSLQT